MKCNFCGETIKEGGIGCDWRQGRCPYRPSMVDEILKDPYKTRFYNLFKCLFKKKKT